MQALEMLKYMCLAEAQLILCHRATVKGSSATTLASLEAGWAREEGSEIRWVVMVREFLVEA